MKSKDVYELLRKVYKGDSLDTKSKTFDYLCDNGLILSIPSDKYKKISKNISTYVKALKKYYDLDEQLFHLQHEQNDLKTKLQSGFHRFFKSEAQLEAEQEELNKLNTECKDKHKKLNNLDLIVNDEKLESLAHNYNNGNSLQNYIKSGDVYIDLSKDALIILPFLKKFVKKNGSKPYKHFAKQIPKIEQSLESNNEEIMKRYHHFERGGLPV